MEITKTYEIVNDIENPNRNGETFTITLPYVSAQHIRKYFLPVERWANGAVIQEVTQ